MCTSENVHIRMIGEPGKMGHANFMWKGSVLGLGLHPGWVIHIHLHLGAI